MCIELEVYGSVFVVFATGLRFGYFYCDNKLHILRYSFYLISFSYNCTEYLKPVAVSKGDVPQSARLVELQCSLRVILSFMLPYTVVGAALLEDITSHILYSAE